MRGILAFALVAALAMAAFSVLQNGAGAADPPKIPNMLGEWSGTSNTVTVLSGKPQLSEAPSTFSVEGQDGRRFWGQSKSAGSSAPFAAIYSTSHLYAYGADTAGTYHFKSLGPDQFEACYMQPAAPQNGSIVAGCTVFTRSKS